MVEGPLPVRVRVASSDVLAPLARLLRPEEVEGLGWPTEARVPVHGAGGRSLVVDDVQRLPDAHKLVLTEGDAGFLLVLLRDQRPEVWRIPTGRAVLLAPGAWHADPIALDGAQVLEAHEPRATFDRVDRAALAELAPMVAIRCVEPSTPLGGPPSDVVARHAGTEGRRTVLGNEPPPVSWEPVFPPLPPPAPALALPSVRPPTLPTRESAAPEPTPSASGPEAPFVALQGDLAGALHVGTFFVEDPPLGPIDLEREAWLEARSRALAAGQRRPLLQRARAFARAVRLPDLDRTARQAVYRGLARGLLPTRAWEAALWAAALAHPLDVVAVEASDLRPPLVLRRGGRAEHAALPSGHDLGLFRTPVLVDEAGPLATLAGPLSRGAVGRRTQRVLVLGFVSIELDAAEARGRLEALRNAIPGRCGPIRLSSGTIPG